MESNAHPMFETPVADGYDRMPASLKPLCEPASFP